MPEPMLYRVTAAQAAQPGGFKLTLARPAVGLLIHAGSPGARIYFDGSSEAWGGERSIEAVTGLCIARDVRTLYVRSPGANEAADVVLEALECRPANVTSLGREHVLFRRVFDGFEIEETNPDPSRTVIVEAFNVSNLATSETRFAPVDGYYLGGALTAGVAFTLRLWARISASERAIVASLEATQADPDGRFSCSLDTGWRKVSSTLGPLHQVPIPLTLPCELELFQATGAALTLDGIVYVRKTT